MNSQRESIFYLVLQLSSKVANSKSVINRLLGTSSTWRNDYNAVDYPRFPYNCISIIMFITIAYHFIVV